MAVGACREDRCLGLDDENVGAAAVEHGRADDPTVVRQQVDEHGVVHDGDAAALGLVHQGVHHGDAGRGAVGVLPVAGGGFEREVPHVGVRGGAVEGDASVVFTLEIDAPVDKLLDPLHGLIHEYLGELLIGEEPSEGDQVAHRRHVRVAVLTIEADNGARADVQRTAAVAELALHDHGHTCAEVARLDGGPQARAATANDQNVGGYGLVHLKSTPVPAKILGSYATSQSSYVVDVDIVRRGQP